jgi:hypothetical protein
MNLRAPALKNSCCKRPGTFDDTRSEYEAAVGFCSQAQKRSTGGTSLLHISIKSLVTSSSVSFFSVRMNDSSDS